MRKLKDCDGVYGIGIRQVAQMLTGDGPLEISAETRVKTIRTKGYKSSWFVIGKNGEERQLLMEMITDNQGHIVIAAYDRVDDIIYVQELIKEEE
jgi:hypothetical protein